MLLTGTCQHFTILHRAAGCLPDMKVSGFLSLRAMACGLPVVVSDAGSLPEVVMDAGLIVDCASAKPLSQALTKLLKDKELQNQLTARGLERVKLFSWTNCAIASLEVYKRVLKSSDYDAETES